MNHSFSMELLPLLSTAQLGGTHSFLSVNYFIVSVVSFLREEDRCPRKTNPQSSMVLWRWDEEVSRDEWNEEEEEVDANYSLYFLPLSILISSSFINGEQRRQRALPLHWTIER